jgi:hypothetical protein
MKTSSYSSAHKIRGQQHRKKFPMADAGYMGVNTLADEFAGIFQRVFGDRKSSAKVIARIAETNERTVENWSAGKNTPSARGLIALMAESEEFCIEVLELAGRSDLAKKVEMAGKVTQLLRIIDKDAAE